MTDPWTVVRAERLDLTEFLASLADEQWDAPTLCSEWRVRDVAGHLIGTTNMKMSPSMLVTMARCGFNVNRLIARDGIERGRAAPTALVDGLRAVIDSNSLPPGVKRPAGMLADAFLHHQDIRRGLGQPRPMPEDRLVATLEELKGYKSPAIDARGRIKGLRLVATDADWATGDGPDVSGPGEALALLMGGRQALLEEVEGEGREALAARL